jgi:hypothetical protein
MPPTPIPHSILFAERVLRDDDDGRPSLIGSFASLAATKFPAQFPMALYANFADAAPGVPFSLKVSGPKGETIIETEVGSNPEASSAYELIVKMDGLPVAAPGLYLFEFLAAGQVVAHRTLQINSVAKQAVQSP